MRRVEYDYDHQSRRVARRHYTRDNVIWQLITTSDLIYDGWNEIAETTTTDESTLTNYYVWGADLSGTLQGAGGIGGLIAGLVGMTQYVISTPGFISFAAYINPDGTSGNLMWSMIVMVLAVVIAFTVTYILGKKQESKEA